VNDLRKQAAILVDEAVRQYKEAKAAESRRDYTDARKKRALEELEHLQSLPPSELTVEQAAKLRSYADNEFWRQYEEDDYYYQSGPERDHHFSMLNKFKHATVRV